MLLLVELVRKEQIHMNSEICSNFSGFRCWNWRLIMILGNFSYLLDMCKIFDKYHVWSWAPTSVRGPTQRSLKVDSWVPGPNCELHIIHLSYTDLWTISFSVLQRLDWSSIEIFHKAAQLLFFQPGQWFPLSMIWCWT